MMTREQVSHLVAFGLDEAQIAYILKCKPEEVRTHYKDEIEHGTHEINARVMAAALYENSAADRKLWLVNKANWRANEPRPGFGEVNADDANAEFSVVQRRTVIERILLRATQDKRLTEKNVTPTRVNGGNGNGG